MMLIEVSLSASWQSIGYSKVEMSCKVTKDGMMMMVMMFRGSEDVVRWENATECESSAPMRGGRELNWRNTELRELGKGEGTSLIGVAHHYFREGVMQGRNQSNQSQMGLSAARG